MEIKNRFYLGKEQTVEIFSGYSYNLSTGEQIDQANTCITVKENVLNYSKITIKGPLHYTQITVLKWNQADEYVGYDVLYTITSEELNLMYEIPKGIKYIAFIFDGTTLSNNWVTRKEIVETEVFPHYKQLKKKYAKENNQVFFRESLDGKINLWGTDYQRVDNASLEDTLLFTVYKNNVLYASATFNKSDCKFDHFKKTVELKLKYNDKYSKILDAYDNTYDLIKLAPALTPLTLTKRSVVQIYIQGENVVSNYSGGTYWETEVDEQINDPGLLINKYYFARGPKYVEVNLQGFNYNINATYRGLWNSNIWNAVSKEEVLGQLYKMPCSIKFNKIANANEYYGASNPGTVKLLSSGLGNGIYSNGSSYFYRYDTYRIEIYTSRDGEGTKIYQSDYLYGKDNVFTIALGNGLYPMTKINQPVPAANPTPATFNLGEYVIEYQVWGRLLCDIESYTYGGQTIETYDLPNDDFATSRRNYRRCIGLTGFDSDNSVVKIYQQQDTVETPTAYGMNDFGEYFIPPYTIYNQYFYPLARSAWANTSMWVMLDESVPGHTFEEWNQVHYKEYTLKNAYHIADVIKTLLAEIDPNITHEKTSEYSQFLYGHSGATASVLNNCDLYITQKTNILKGEYDQAAQKAEIKFKQIMDMLRDCFRCYWFIDDQNRLRIEHIKYFMNGLNYYSSTVQLDLTAKQDKFNKKQALYCQREMEFDKTELTARYEFNWMDDVTDSMGNLVVDVKNNYIQKDKTEEINIDGFTADIDYMLFLPDDFSNDGFALLMADSDKKVPIVHQQIKSKQQYNVKYDVYVQNWYLSFNQLIWHYMEDMPGDIIEYNNISGSLYVNNMKRCVKHDIEFSSKDLTIDVYKMITTDEGNGYIEEVITNIDTDLTEVELRYTPS